ncbi:MAG: DUF1302 domain-containing protein [Gammaproteobacteria bacterium]|nr:DUF1302 domain-containing protein [Gammaproteobacteria bacterium]MCZ6826701.1 DUF1302 domain-containing protein [Gammaproteobacteria bacterium]MCZ6911441.1 DUF1302 domain-containing protein [Pseudomonadota bacterium]
MKTIPTNRRRQSAPLRGAILFALCLSILLVSPAWSVEFGDSTDGLHGNWDTTVSYGQTWRVQSPDLELIGLANGGTALSLNHDDGTLNYDTGTISRVFKITTEIEANYKNFGFFVRGFAFFDEWSEEHDRLRTPLGSQGNDLVSSDFRVLDLYLSAQFDLGSVPGELRVGSQVLNWGESTFFPGGINIISHFDVSRLRTPGAELREALIPQDLAWLSLGTSENTNIELFYQFEWDDTKPDPVGSAFSTNDFAVADGEKVMLGFGIWSDLGTDFSQFNGGTIDNFSFVNRLPDRDAKDSGQFGARFTWYVDSLFDGTEFGFYYINYHSRLPYVNALTGTQAGVANGVGAGTAVGGAAQAIASGLPLNTAIAVGTQAGIDVAAAAGGNYDAASAAQAATIGANAALQGVDALALANSFAISEYAQTASYFVNFPEDIEVFGVSFNTQIFGIAVQGEVAYRDEHPLLVDDVELLFAALSPLNAALGAFGQLGPFGTNQEIIGGREFRTTQYDLTLTKLFGPTLGASQAVLLWEGGLFRVSNMPDKSSGGPNGFGLRLNGPGTDISGNAPLSSAHFGLVEAPEHFASASSWGYRLVGRLDYDSLIGPWNVAPRFAFAHDVDGVSPGPGGLFVEDRKAFTFGVAATYQNTWVVDLSYTEFLGAGHYNLINDRDFIAFSVKTSF